MYEKQLFEYINSIEEVDEEAIEKATQRQGNLVKPPGALGDLETISIKYAGITGEVKNHLKKTAVIILSSDNGVVEEGVTPSPQSVTTMQTMNFLRRNTGVGALAKCFNSDLCVIDMGVKEDFPKELVSDEMYRFIDNKIINRKIAYGTKNLAKEKAMSREEALGAIAAGIEAVEVMKAREYDIIGVGEMGIGNTTTSAAVLSAVTGASVEISVGRGGGLNDAGFARKKEIVKTKGLETKYDDILDIVSSIGGFDLCGMIGVYLGAAKNKMPVVIDGYISAVGALCAYKLQPKVKEYMFGSHQSKEPGYVTAMDAIGLNAMFNLNMRLGEGSGTVIAFEIVKGALACMRDMATYEEGQIDENYLALLADAKF